MDNQWWITGLEESEVTSESIKSPESGPMRWNRATFRLEPIERKKIVMVGEDFFSIDEHFHRIRNIILAPILILFISAIFPPIALLMILYPIYIFYSFLISMNLNGKNLALGFLIGNLLLFPASITLIQMESFDDFIATLFLPLVYFLYLLYALDSTSTGHKITSIGMFYGILFGLAILLPISLLIWLSVEGWLG